MSASPETAFLIEHCSDWISKVALAFAGVPDEDIAPILLKACQGIVEQLEVAIPGITPAQSFAWVDALQKAIGAELNRVEAHGAGGHA